MWAGEEAASTRPLQYVFRDLDNEIVVSYPHPEGRIITFRFWLPNRVEPQIAASVARTESRSQTTFTYTYKLRNGSNAVTAIKRWSVVGPVSEDLTVEHPVWRSLKSRSSVAPQALVPQAGRGAYIAWRAANAPYLAPEEEMTDFKISSRFSPGLTTAYARGEGLIEEPGPGELPEEVVQQLIPLQRAPVWQKPAITIGPRFAPGTSPEAILRAFSADVADLIQEGLLSAESPYVQELQQMFASVSDDIRDQVLGREETPSTPLERDLELALRLTVLSAR